MQPMEIKPGIYWVGAVDWQSRDFHGYSLSPNGTTYNAFFVKDEKNTLFDTVKIENLETLLCRLTQAVGELTNIDQIVVNHLEPDHAGALAKLVELCQPEKVYCSAMGKRAMDNYFHGHDWPVEVVKTGDEISLGSRTVRFIETRMLHWPDSMASYLVEDKLLICNDAFGQNIASNERYADQIDRCLLEPAMRNYYANIVNPYSPVTLKTLDAIAEMGIEIEMLLPDHGLIFRGEDVAYAINLYREFAEQKPKNKAVVIYDTMWHSTEKMAEALCEGLASEGAEVKLMWLKANHHSRVMYELHDAGCLVLGCPTHNNGILPLMAGTLQYLKGLRPQNKIGGAFGSYGWSGESVKVLTEWLHAMSIETPVDPVKVNYGPDHDQLKACTEMGRQLAVKLKEFVAENG